MFITSQDIENLEVINSTQNDGRGVSCVRAILAYLKSRRSNEKDAQRVRQLNFTTTKGYPELERQLQLMFGCGNHGLDSCEHEACQIPRKP